MYTATEHRIDRYTKALEYVDLVANDVKGGTLDVALNGTDDKLFFSDLLEHTLHKVEKE